MNSLPLELKYHILLQADLSTLDSLCQTSKSYLSICLDEQFWINKIKKDYLIDTRCYLESPHFDPYFQYQVLYITNGEYGGTLRWTKEVDCLHQIGRSARTCIINYYFKNLGYQYNYIYRALIKGALEVNGLKTVFYILDRLDRNGPNGDPLVDVLKLASKKDLHITILLIERYPSLDVPAVADAIKKAIENARLDIIKYLTGEGEHSLPLSLYEKLYPADTNSNISLNHIDYDVLCRAIYLGNYDIIKYFVDKYFAGKKSYPDRYKRVLMNIAARQPDTRISSYLKAKIPSESWYRRYFNK